MTEVLRIENVSKKFGSFVALESSNFYLNENEIYGLLGPNGAGKSTLAKIACGLSSPSSGNIYVLGKKVGFFFKFFNKFIGVVPQEIACYQGFTVKQNFLFFGRLYDIPNNKLIERVEFLLEWLNLKQFEERKIEHLSGGYKRLVNIGLALIHDPKIIFLDEPTVGLDPSVRAMFWDKIKELKKHGKSMILTTHYMDEAQELCDRIAIMNKGKILVEGSPEKLIQEYGGKKIVILNLDKPFDELLLDSLKVVVGFDDGKILGNQLIISFQKEVSLSKVTQITDFIRKSKYEIKSSHIREPELEDVFINLTGKKIRDFEKTAGEKT